MPLHFIGYKYNKRKVLSFVFTPGAGTIMKSTNSYGARLPDKFGNLHVRKVPPPDVLTSYFSKCNVIDVHNQSRQHDLAIEESWVTSEPYFRLCTTIIGIVVTDAWKLVRFHSKKWSNERIIAFSNRLCYSILSDISRCAYPVDELMIETQQSGHSSLTGEVDDNDVKDKKVCKHTMQKLPKLKTKPKLPTRSGSVGSTSYTKQIRCV